MADIAAITIPVNTNQITMAIGQVSKLEGQIIKLERARQRGIITDQQFEKSLGALSKRMNRFAADTKQAEEEIKRFGNSVRDADAKTLNNLGRGLGESQKGFARFGLAAQQSGYQVGDFFVQIASGTSPMVAFTQQFSQLAGFFGGPWGAVIGAVAAIGGAAYIAFSGATKEVDTFQESLDNLKESTASLKDDLNIAVGGYASVEQLKLAESLNEKLKEAGILELERRRILEESSGVATVQLYNKNKEIAANQVLIDQAISELEASQQVAKELERNNVIIDLMAEGVNEAAIRLLEMSGVDLSNLSDAARDAAVLAENLGIALSDAYSLQNLRSSKDYGGRGGDPRDFMSGGNQSYDENNRPFVYEAPKRGGGGSKVDPVEQLRKQFDALMGSMDPVIQAQNQYNDSLKMLNDALAKGAISQAQYDAGLAGITKRLQEAKDPLTQFKKSLEDALDPNKNYIKGLQALQSSLSDFLFNPFEVGVQGMIYNFSRALQRMASDALAAGFMKMLVGGAMGADGSVGGGILKFLGGSANGNVFDGGSKVTAFANGCVVGSPTMFPLKGGMGLMGEAGPEAIMPLKRGANGKLGVAVSGEGGQAKATKIINVLDPRIVGEYLNTPDGEEVIMNVMRRTGAM